MPRLKVLQTSCSGGHIWQRLPNPELPGTMIVLSLEGIKTSKGREKRKSSCQPSQEAETQVSRESQETASLSPREPRLLPPGGGGKGLQAAAVSWLRLSLQTLRNRGYCKSTAVCAMPWHKRQQRGSRTKTGRRSYQSPCGPYNYAAKGPAAAASGGSTSPWGC